MLENVDWIASAVAAVAAFIAILAWLEARRLRADTAETGKLQTRAYITAETCDCELGSAGGGILGVSLGLLNSGQTPTLRYDIDVAIRFIAIDPAQREPWQAAAGDDYFAVLPGTLLPGARGNAVYTFSEALIEKTRMANIGSAEPGALVVHGSVTYTDIYGDRFRSPFHFEAVVASSRHLPRRLLARPAGAPFQGASDKPATEQRPKPKQSQGQNFKPGDL